MEHPLSFGYWVRRRRKALDLTQVDLAQRVGCAETTIRKIEADERRPSKQMAECLAEQLALTPEERAAFLKAARAELAADQLAMPATPVVQAALPPPPRSRHLPIPLTPLIGRAHELAAVSTHLQRGDVRLLTLLGAGGTGKTRLALEVAHELAAEFADGVCFVDLAPIRDPALVASTIAQTLGVVEVAGQPILESLTTHLCAKQALLVLDNFEQILEAAPLVTELLASCPNVKVLVTSRAVLRVSGEHHYVVPPLDVPAATEHDPGSLAQCAAVRLFVARAQAVKPEFTLSAANAGAVAEVCRRLDGLPLALELAAARSTVLSPQALLTRLGSRLRLLRDGARDMPERQQTLRAAIEWSYLLLGEGERALLRRLGVFVGGWTLEAAEAVCNLEGELDVLEGIFTLVDHSLVRAAEEANGEPRFTMLETIREYALEQLEGCEEAEATQRAHAASYLAVAEAAEVQIHRPEQLLWLERLETEHDNLRAALAWAQEHDIERGLCLAGALWRFWWRRGYRSEGRAWLEGMLTQGTTASAAVRAKVLLGAGWLAGSQGDQARAAVLGEACLALAREAQDTPNIASALLVVAIAADSHGDAQRALALFEESLALARTIGDPVIMTLALGNVASLAFRQGDLGREAALVEECHALARSSGDRWSIAASLEYGGWFAFRQGEYAVMRTRFEEQLAISREMGAKPGTAGVLDNLGELARFQGEYGAARSFYEEALSIWREVGTKGGIAGSLQGLGLLALEQGAYGVAQARLEESLVVHREGGDKPGIALSLRHLGLVARDQGDFERATACFEEALAIWREMGDKSGIATVLGDLGLTARFQGDYVRAAAYCEEGLALRRELGLMGWGIPWSLIDLGRVMHDQGDLERAAALYQESLALFCDEDNRRAIAHCVECLARVVAAPGHPPERIQRAARLWGAAAALRETIGAPLPPVDQMEHAQAVTRARTHLDAAMFDAAWAEGRAISLEQAVAYALAEDAEHPAVGGQ